MANYYSWTRENNLRRMDMTAIYAGARKVTFEEAFRGADSIADRLSALGLKSGDFVLASMMPSPEGVELMLACAKLDVCCMMLLPGAKDEKVLSFIEAEGVRFAFIEEVFLGALLGMPESLNALEGVYALPHDVYVADHHKTNIDYEGAFAFAKSWDAFMALAGVRTEAVAEPKSPLYIAATPTHDNPKGIMYSHEAMIEAARMLPESQQNMRPGMIIDSRIPMFTAAGNSMETMTPFAAGLAIATGQVPMADGEGIPEEFEKYAPNCLMIAKTSILQAMDNPAMSKLDFSQLASLYNIGEPLSEEEKKVIGDFFVSRNAKTTVRNAYGLSESNCILTAEAPSYETSSTVGRPMPGVELRIVDPDTLQDVDAGCPGEIVYSAPCMMDGYFKDEEATNERLFTGADGKTYDRTGDLGCLDARGNLRILGRVEERYKDEGGNTRYFFEIRKAVESCPCFASAYIVAHLDGVYIHYTEGDPNESGIARLRERLMADGMYRTGHFFVKRWDEIPTSGGRVRSYVLSSSTEGAVSMDEFGAEA
ncbi:MAG: AMP-binding protein [Olsenella sp.]|nr:AMP-binding protein [Olsenella sp.]